MIFRLQIFCNWPKAALRRNCTERYARIKDCTSYMLAKLKSLKEQGGNLKSVA